MWIISFKIPFVNQWKNNGHNRKYCIVAQSQYSPILYNWSLTLYVGLLRLSEGFYGQPHTQWYEDLSTFVHWPVKMILIIT